MTGGAPELAPCFRRLVSTRAAARAARDRPLQPDRAARAGPGGPGARSSRRSGSRSSPACRATDPRTSTRSAAPGVFEKSIRALRALNALGYGRPESPLRLDLVYNPVGAHLPPRAGAPRGRLPRAARRRASASSSTACSRSPTCRSAASPSSWRARARRERYMALLVNHFNPATVDGLMCRDAGERRLRRAPLRLRLQPDARAAARCAAGRARSGTSTISRRSTARRSRPARTASAAPRAPARAAAARSPEPVRLSVVVPVLDEARRIAAAPVGAAPRRRHRRGRGGRRRQPRRHGRPSRAACAGVRVLDGAARPRARS